MFFMRKNDGRVMLIIEVQSSLVRGSLHWERPGRPTHILYIDERPLAYKAHVGASYLVKTTLKAITLCIRAAATRYEQIRRAGRAAGQRYPRRVETVHYILSSPWIASQARTLTIDLGREENISPARISAILETERARLSQKDVASTETIEEKIFDVRLNGYSVGEWRDKRARELGISYAVTVGAADATRHLREAAEAIVGRAHIRFHSSLLLQYIGMRSVMPHKDSYMLIHVHGELTDAVAVRNGSCVFFGSYPMGIGTIIRKVAHASHLDIRTAESLLTLYLGHKLDDTQMAALEPLIRDMRAGWSGEFDKLVRAGASDQSVSDAILSQVFISARQHEKLFVDGYTERHPGAEIETMSGTDTVSGTEFAPAVTPNRSVALYASALSVL